MNPRSVGVEEELLPVEPRTGRPQAVAGTVLHAAEQAAPRAGTSQDAAAELELELPGRRRRRGRTGRRPGGRAGHLELVVA